LQSSEWRKFQESVGRKTHNVSSDSFFCNIIEHTLPIVGKYFYIPRGPVMEISKSKCQISNQIPNPNDKIKENILELISLAKENGSGWIRIEPASSEILEAIKSNTQYKVTKAPHDMQPRELFVIDITKSEEQLLSEMKPKTRYNIKVAQKHGVKILVKKNIDEFIRLTQIMAKRQGIATHPGEYYKKMCEDCTCLKMYLAEYEGKIIAANLIVFFGKTCTYLHGASDDQYRNVMAPFLLQWQQILDAKEAGCEKYDFGGVKTWNMEHGTRNNNSWAGITRFKLGFSPETKSTEFPGAYDIIINPVRYWVYRRIQKLKSAI